jgi:soluble lytic murein transglycosylase-like protein
MALTLEQIRSIPGYEEMSDDDIVKHGESIGMQIADAPKSPEEAGALRSYVGIPLLKGTADIGSTVGYGLEAVGAKAAGRALQDSGQQLQETLTQRQSKQAQEDAKKTLIDENGHYGGYNFGTLVQDVATSAPGTLAMGVAGAPLAKGVTAASKAIGLGEKAARIAGTGSLGRALAAGLDTVAGNAVGFGAAEGAYSGASNAAQLQHEIRNADINKLSEHPAFVDAYHQNTDPALTPEERLYQAREVIAEKAADDVFADTFVKTGGISALTGGGVFGMVRDNVVKKAAGEATEGFIKSAGKGFLKEGLLQEAPQSGLEQRTINQAKRDYTDQNQDLSAGVWNAAGQGGIAGGVMGLAGGAGSNSQPTTGDQNGINTETSSPSSPDQTQQSEPGAAAMPDESVLFEPEQPSGSAGGANSQGGFDVAANPHEAYQKRAALKKRLIDTRQALKTGEDADGSRAQELAGIEAEFNALDAGLTDWEKNSEEGKAHRKEALAIKKNAAAGDIVTHTVHGEVKITNAGRTSATISTLDDQPLGEAPYHALKGLKKPQPRTEYDDVIKAAADKHGIPAEFLKAVALQESGVHQFDKDGKPLRPGTSNALGIMQIIPKWHPEFDAERLANDAEYNIDAGAQFLGDLIKKHGGDLHKAAQSYYSSKDAAENSKYADSVLSRMSGTNPEAGSNERRTVQGTQEQRATDGLGSGSDNGATDHSQVAETGDGKVIGEEKEKQVRVSESGQEVAQQTDTGPSSTQSQELEAQKAQDSGSGEVLQGGDQIADEMPVHDDQASESSAPNVFVATHELSDGTKVTHVEGNTYRDENGDEYQDDYAEKLQPATEPVRGDDRLEPDGSGRPVGGNDSNFSEPQQKPVSSGAGGQHIGRNSLTAIDAAAHEAALSPTNDLPEPTAAQKDAGNYKKGHVKLHGFDIAIENPKGSKRSGTDSDGNKWSVDMANHYGYIKRSTGADNEHIDVFVGDHHNSDKAYVVNQINPKTGKFDEHKVMLGFENKTKAKVGYLKNYAKGWKGLGSITEVPVSELKAQIESGAIRKPIRNHTTEIPATEDPEVNGMALPTQADKQTYQASNVQGGRTGGESIPSTAQQPTEDQQWQKAKEKAAAEKSADLPINTGAASVAPDIQQPTQEAISGQSTNQAEKETEEALTHESAQTNNRIPAVQPDPQNPDTNPAQPVAPAAQENLAGKVAEPVAVNPIINTSEVDWVKAKLDEQGMRSGAPGYAKAVKATKAQYQADLDKALASAPFEVFAAHPSNKGLPEGVVRQAHEVLREEHGVASKSELTEPVNKSDVKFSRSPATRQAYERRIDELFANPQSIDRKSLREIKMLDRGDVLDLVGHGNLPVYVHEAHAVDDGRYNHPLSAEQWKKIPEWLENPALVLERASDGHLTIIAPEKSADGKTIVIGLEPKAAENARSGLQERHLVLTAYPKDRGVLPINRDIESGHYKPLFVDQKKGPDFYRGSGLNYSSDAGKLRAWNKSLKIDRDLVKYRKAQETGGLPSKTDQPVSGSTVADVKSWLPKSVKRLLDAGKLRVEQSASDIPQTAHAFDADGIEGFYDPDEDVVYLIADNLTQDNLQSVLAHELLHRAEATDPQLKAAISRFENMLERSFKHAAAGRGSAIEKAAYQRVIDAGTPAEDQAAEYRAYLVTEYSKKPDSFGGMIKKAIQDFIAAIRAALIRSGLDMGFIKSLTPADLAAMSRYGAKVASSNVKQTGENGKDAQFSLGENTKAILDRFRQGVRDVLTGKTGLRELLVLAKQSPQVFTLSGMNDLPVITLGRVIDKAHFDHGLPEAMLQRLPELLADPVMVFESDTEKNGYVVVTEVFHKGNPVIAAVHANRLIGRTEVNFISTSLPKDNPLIFDKWLKGGLLRYLNEEKTPSWRTTAQIQHPGLARVQFPRVVHDKKGSSKNIATQRDLVKSGGIKFSRASTGKNGVNNTGYRQWLSDENKKLADTAIYNLQNRFIDLKRQMEKVVKTGGAFTENQDPYMAEELYHQRSASRMKDFHDNELLPILQGLHDKRISIEDFQKFLHARHAPSRNRVMAERNPNQAIIDQKLQEAEDALESLRKNPATPAKELQAALREVNKWNRAKPFQGSEDERLSLSGMSDQEAKAYMDGLEPIVRKRMTDLADKIDAINNKTLDLMTSYGMETPESIQALKDQWEHYVPLHRDEAHPEDGNFGHPIGRGFSVRGSGLKTATGSNAEVTNILAHIAAARDQMIRRGEKNRVSVMLANFIHANPDDSFAELGKVPIEDVLVNGLVESRPDPLYKNRDNVVLFRANGGDHAIVFNEHNPEAVRLALTWKNMDGIELSLAAKIAAKGTRWLASVNTQYNVIFGLVNLIRDTQGALLNLSSTPLAGKQRQVFGHLGGALSAIAGIERGWSGADPQLKAMYERFNKAGGTTGYSQMFDGIKERNRSIEKDLANIGAGGFKKFGLATTKWLSDFNTVMENGTRLAAFMAGVDAGLSDAKAASIAKNITVNFNRKGAFTTNVGAFYAFFNASMQGTARLAETLSGPAGRRIMIGGVMLGAATTLIGILAMGEDDWEDIPEFVRERSLIAPLPGGHYFAVPMPLGFHILPNIGRKFVESAFGSKRVSKAQRFAQLAGSVGGGFNPLGGSDISQMIMPTVLDPALALWRNKDWTGRRIYQEDFNTLKPTPGFTRTKDTATVASKLAAEAINKATGGTNYKPGFWSPTPDQIDYVFGQLFGGSGREVMKAEQAAESLATGEELPLYKVPLIGRFFGETEGSAVERAAYYDNVRRLNEHHAELEGLAGEEHGAKKRADYLQEHPEARLYELAKNAQKTIDGMKKRRELLTKRGQSTRQIDDQITVRMKALNDAVEAKIR